MSRLLFHWGVSIKTTAKAKAKAKALARRLWVLYRITPAEQKSIEVFQAKHTMFRELLGKHLGTDHDHATGLIRGRIEWRLNRTLGLLEKVAGSRLSSVLWALAEYMDNPPAVTALGAPRYGLMGLAKYKRKMLYGPPPGTLAEKRNGTK